MEAWEEQRLIGWDQILKGRISTKWGKAQGLFYGNNPTTRKEKHFTAEVWVSKTIASLLRFTLGLWKDRCDTLHGATLVERQRMKRDKIMDRLKLCYIQRDTIPECYRYIFRDAYETIGKKSTQYLVKWVSTFMLLQKQGGHVEGRSQRRVTRRGSNGTNLQRSTNKRTKAKAYSQKHNEWMGEREQDGPSRGDTGGSG